MLEQLSSSDRPLEVIAVFVGGPMDGAKEVVQLPGRLLRHLAVVVGESDRLAIYNQTVRIDNQRGPDLRERLTYRYVYRHTKPKNDALLRQLEAEGRLAPGRHFKAPEEA